MFNKKVTSSKQYSDTKYEIIWELDEDRAFGRLINIYELAHKCKEWALKRNIKVYSLLVKDGGKVNIHRVVKDLPNIDITFRGSSEPEAIFKACEWILKDLNGK